MQYQITYVDHDGNTVKRQVPAEALDLRENNVARYKGYALLVMQPSMELETAPPWVDESETYDPRIHACGDDGPEQVCDCCGSQCPTGFEATPHGNLCEECCDNMELEL